MNRSIRALAVAPALAAAIMASAACAHHNSPQLTPSQKAALAPYEAVVQKDVSQVGGPVALIHRQARHELFSDLKHMVPKAQRDAFVNAAVNAALKGHLLHHSGRETYVQVTLPQLLQKYGAHLS